MHCFNHPETTARQLCGGCLKGLCPKCSIPSQTRLESVVCSETCRTNFDHLQQINDKAMIIYGIGDKAKKELFISPNTLSFIILGIFFFIFGAYPLYYYGYDFIYTLFCIMGIITTIIGIYTYFRQKKIGLRL